MIDRTDLAFPCCHEAGCTRKKPILVRRGAFSGRWYVVTAYKERSGGMVETHHGGKHDVTEDLERELIAAGWTPPPSPEDHSTDPKVLCLGCQTQHHFRDLSGDGYCDTCEARR